MANETKHKTKLGPGEYRPDPTEGIQRVEDLPKLSSSGSAATIGIGVARSAVGQPIATGFCSGVYTT